MKIEAQGVLGVWNDHHAKQLSKHTEEELLTLRAMLHTIINGLAEEDREIVKMMDEHAAGYMKDVRKGSKEDRLLKGAIQVLLSSKKIRKQLKEEDSLAKKVAKELEQLQKQQKGD